MKKEKTREIIADSFRDLLETTSFNKITTQMICDASGISKATFYRLYSDKYDVMNTFFRIRCDRLLEDNPGPGNCLKFLKEYSNLIVTFKDYFKAVLTAEGQNSFWEYLYECGMSYYLDHIKQETGGPVSEDLQIQITIFTSGTVFVTKKWVEGELIVPEDKIAEIVYHSMPEEMKKYFHKNS